jgi:hypothetical protein
MKTEHTVASYNGSDFTKKICSCVYIRSSSEIVAKERKHAWLISFMNDVLSSARLRAKDIAIPKPSKLQLRFIRFMLKFMRTVQCAKISNLLNSMLSNHFFQVFLGNHSSKWRQLNNSLPQGSVLTPILFNLYMSDLPSSSLNLFQCAEDIALTHQA